jgi:hypothetical protein
MRNEENWRSDTRGLSWRKARKVLKSRCTLEAIMDECDATLLTRFRRGSFAMAYWSWITITSCHRQIKRGIVGRVLLQYLRVMMVKQG